MKGNKRIYRIELNNLEAVIVSNEQKPEFKFKQSEELDWIKADSRTRRKRKSEQWARISKLGKSGEWLNYCFAYQYSGLRLRTYS